MQGDDACLRLDDFLKVFDKVENLLILHRNFCNFLVKQIAGVLRSLFDDLLGRFYGNQALAFYLVVFGHYYSIDFADEVPFDLL